MIVFIKLSKYTVELRRTGDRIAEQAISRASYKSKAKNRSNQIAVNGVDDTTDTEIRDPRVRDTRSKEYRYFIISIF